MHASLTISARSESHLGRLRGSTDMIETFLGFGERGMIIASFGCHSVVMAAQWNRSFCAMRCDAGSRHVARHHLREPVGANSYETGTRLSRLVEHSSRLFFPFQRPL